MQIIRLSPIYQKFARLQSESIYCYETGVTYAIFGILEVD